MPTREENLAVLGLKDGASRQRVGEALNKILRENHADKLQHLPDELQKLAHEKIIAAREAAQTLYPDLPDAGLRPIDPKNMTLEQRIARDLGADKVEIDSKGTLTIHMESPRDFARNAKNIGIDFMKHNGQQDLASGTWKYTVHSGGYSRDLGQEITARRIAEAKATGYGVGGPDDRLNWDNVERPGNTSSPQNNARAWAIDGLPHPYRLEQTDPRMGFLVGDGERAMWLKEGKIKEIFPDASIREVQVSNSSHAAARRVDGTRVSLDEATRAPHRREDVEVKTEPPTRPPSTDPNPTAARRVDGTPASVGEATKAPPADVHSRLVPAQMSREESVLAKSLGVSSVHFKPDGTMDVFFDEAHAQDHITRLESSGIDLEVRPGSTNPASLQNADLGLRKIEIPASRIPGQIHAVMSEAHENRFSSSDQAHRAAPQETTDPPTRAPRSAPDTPQPASALKNNGYVSENIAWASANRNGSLQARIRIGAGASDAEISAMQRQMRQEGIHISRDPELDRNGYRFFVVDEDHAETFVKARSGVREEPPTQSQPSARPTIDDEKTQMPRTRPEIDLDEPTQPGRPVSSERTEPPVTKPGAASSSPTPRDPDIFGFDLEIERNTPRESFSDGGISGARLGKPGKNGIIEDNGSAHRIGRGLSRAEAQEVLRQPYARIRALPAHENGQAAATAASAALTPDGVAIRGAGDGVVMAVGPNGKVAILNRFHSGEEDQVVTNALIPGNNLEAHDFTDYKSWDEIRTELGLKPGDPDPKMLVASDGIYGRLREADEIANHAEKLIKQNGLKIDDPHFADSFVDAAVKDPVFAGKRDDVIVFASSKPAANESVVLHAIDGVGSGERDSAVVAHQAANYSHDSARHFSDPASSKRWIPDQTSGGVPRTSLAIEGMEAGKVKSLTEELKSRGFNPKLESDPELGNVLRLSGRDARIFQAELDASAAAAPAPTGHAQTPPDGSAGKAAAKVGDEAVENLSRMGRLGRWLRTGGRVLGVGAVATTASLVMSEKAHAERNDAITEFVKSGDLTEDQADELRRMNDDGNNADRVNAGAGAVPVVGIVPAAAGEIAGEAAKQATWEEFLRKNPDLDQKVVDRLGDTLFPVYTAAHNLREAARGALPGDPAEVPEALRGLAQAQKEYADLEKLRNGTREKYVQIQRDSAANRENQGAWKAQYDKDLAQADAKVQAEMDKLLADPEKAVVFLQNTPPEARLDYARRMAAADPKFAENNPEVAAYLKEQDNKGTFSKLRDKVMGPDSQEADRALNAYIARRAAPPPAEPDDKTQVAKTETAAPDAQKGPDADTAKAEVKPDAPTQDKEVAHKGPEQKQPTPEEPEKQNETQVAQNDQKPAGTTPSPETQPDKSEPEKVEVTKTEPKPEPKEMPASGEPDHLSPEPESSYAQNDKPEKAESSAPQREPEEVADHKSAPRNTEDPLSPVPQEIAQNGYKQPSETENSPSKEPEKTPDKPNPKEVADNSPPPETRPDAPSAPGMA